MPDFERTRLRNHVPIKKYMGYITLGAVNTLACYTPEYLNNAEITKDNVHVNFPLEGGEFSSNKVSVDLGEPVTVQYGVKYDRFPTYNRYYVGETSIMPPLITDITTLDKHEECRAYGPACWEKFKPAKPVVSLSIALAELKDAPSLMLKRLNKFRNLGSNYLAVEFGWKPFISDLRRLWSSIGKIDDQIAQLKRDNGRWIRRSGTYLETKEDVTSPITDSLITPLNAYTAASTLLTQKYKRVQSSERVWFSGKFRYYIPGLDDPRWGKWTAIKHLWDLDIGPEQVYELIPFSWLVDWFSNLGSLISNLASITEDNLVAQYAYVMRSTMVTTTYTCTLRTSLFDRDQGKYIFKYYPLSASKVESTKDRCVASPFGFNIELPDFSTWQLSILAALGISRL